MPFRYPLIGISTSAIRTVITLVDTSQHYPMEPTRSDASCPIQVGPLELAIRLADSSMAATRINLIYLRKIEDEIPKIIWSATVPALEDVVRKFHRADERKLEPYETLILTRLWDPFARASKNNIRLAAADFVAAAPGKTSRALALHKATRQFLTRCRPKKYRDSTNLVAEWATVLHDEYFDLLENYALKLTYDDMDVCGAAIEGWHIQLTERQDCLIETLQNAFKKSSEDALLFIAQARGDNEAALACAELYGEFINDINKY